MKENKYVTAFIAISFILLIVVSFYIWHSSKITEKQTKAKTHVNTGLPVPVKEYYQLYSNYKSFNFSDTTDEKFKEYMGNRFKRIFMPPLLDDYLSFLNNGSINSDYYPSFFEFEKSPRILHYSYKNGVCTVFIQKYLELSAGWASMEGAINLDTIAKDLKINNITQDEINRKLNDNSDKSNLVLKLDIYEKDTFQIISIVNPPLVSSMNREYLSTTMNFNQALDKN
ncbi:MAG: hypothetical protein DKM50_08385 [Candidatus Margulisiibacteriota bacterium]|nr:MAG: hypothetical protein A2X43_03165 [Candidatus Margulisbacteria bacterium GWD2_39_127]PZM79613.1 MAG: hypothetical protein DKM50_08385 [Candidatus Margulisiibacteriota bacterium]HAR63205.1 hypothetical protein [Candidatus Margulisiibacteriota bacterium]HCT83761.1 hypothetical protein [Candidatus Margulisiibacteriota bacterium]HCY37281.1 hypothetical protein [Candidatus Margulisiibacteriota bacterium]